MDDELNERQRKKARLEMLNDRAMKASEANNFEGVAQLLGEITKIRHELGREVNQLSGGVQEEKEARLEMLVGEGKTASEREDFEKVAHLQDEILKILHELEPEVSQLPSAVRQEEEEPDWSAEDSATASEEQDYEKAAQLREEALKKESGETTAEERHERVPSEEHATELPAHSLEAEIEFETGRRNFVRAAMLAEQCQYPPKKVRHLQEQALKQYAFEYRNAQGLRKLVEWYGFSKSDAQRIILEGLSQWNGFAGLQYDMNVMSHITLEQFIDNVIASKL